MDVNMPGGDGIETTRAILRQWPEIQVIGLSMFDEAEQGAAMRAAGAAGYCTKSAAPTSLVAIIRASARSGGRRQGTRVRRKPSKNATAGRAGRSRRRS